MNTDRHKHWPHVPLSWTRQPKHTLIRLLPALLCLALLLSALPAWASAAGLAVAGPADASCPLGGEASFLVTASGGNPPYTFTWEYFDDGGNRWLPASGSLTPVSPDPSTSRLPVPASRAWDRMLLRCDVMDLAATSIMSETARLSVMTVVPQRLAQNDFTGQAGAWGDLTVALAFAGGSEAPLTVDLSLGGYQKPVVLPNTLAASNTVLPASELNRLAPGTYDLLLSWSETPDYDPVPPTVIGTVTVVAAAPQTGDGAAPGLWLALCAAAGFCALLLLRGRRGKRA